MQRGVMPGPLAEWSNALDLGSSPRGRRFEPCKGHILLFAVMQLRGAAANVRRRSGRDPSRTEPYYGFFSALPRTEKIRTDADHDGEDTIAEWCTYSTLGRLSQPLLLGTGHAC